MACKALMPKRDFGLPMLQRDQFTGYSLLRDDKQADSAVQSIHTYDINGGTYPFTANSLRD